ncbi:MAG TPA: hypothetical protein VNJ71_14105 [Gemmatimonadales bacterium]|nr:hypothetical protein [Gemmatimonadales bacterium]
MRRLAALLVLAACDHAEPFRPPDPREPGPFRGALPRQLTFNRGTDRMPSWSSDGRYLLYSYEDLSRTVPDRCLGVLPAGGGSRVRSACQNLPGFADSLDAFEWPAERGGRVAYLVATSGALDDAPSRRALVVAPLADLLRTRRLVSFPYHSSTGRPHDLALAVSWLDSTTILYIGAVGAVVRPCLNCRSDTLFLGQDLVRLDLRTVPPTREDIPGTYLANSAAPAPDGRSVYYTVAGDSRVLRRDLVTGTVTEVHDFGLGRFARDVQVAGERLVAVVGGRISLTSDPLLGLLARDEGGQLVEVDLRAGAERPLPLDQRFYRRPALSPDGRRLAVEAFPFTVTVIRDPAGNILAADTAVARAADLWLLEE